MAQYNLPDKTMVERNNDLYEVTQQADSGGNLIVGLKTPVSTKFGVSLSVSAMVLVALQPCVLLEMV